MGYQVTIRSEQPITLTDWKSYLNTNSELAYADENGEVVRWTHYPEKPELHWELGEIWAWNPDELMINKMLEIARAFEAGVIGEDGTVFFLNEEGRLDESS